MSTVEERIGYRFREQRLRDQALTHPSTAKTMAGQAYNNQRLEFLGDAVLGMCVAGMLYEMYPNEAEGDLSRRLVSLVNGSVLAQVAVEWQLGDALILSPSEADAGGRTLSSNLEDACEAIIGAIFLEAGIEAVRPIVERFWKPLAESNRVPPKDPKTALQEWAQAAGTVLPDYKVIEESGPAHAPQFTVEVTVATGEAAYATAGSKKQAERLAAEALLVQIGKL